MAPYFWKLAHFLHKALKDVYRNGSVTRGHPMRSNGMPVLMLISLVLGILMGRKSFVARYPSDG